MRINYKKIRKNTFNKSNVNKLFKEKKKVEKKIKKIEKKITQKVEKLNEKIIKQLEENKVIFNKNDVEEIVDLENQQNNLECHVKSLEETIDELEEKENAVLDELL